MKIAQIAPGFVEVPPQRGGAVERHVAGLSKGLEDLACKVRIFARQRGVEETDAIDVKCLPPKVGQQILPAKVAGTLVYSANLRKHLIHDPYDIIHFHGGIAGLIQSSLIRRSNARRVLTVHNALLFSQNVIERSVAAIVESTSALRVDAVIAVSRSVKEVLERRMRRSVVHYIPNGVYVQRDVDEQKAKRCLGYDSRLVLFVGRITYQKGVHVLLESFRKMIYDRGIRNLMLVLVGPPADVFRGHPSSYFKTILNQIAELHGNVVYEGNVPSDALMTIYASADLIVLPSLADAMPIVLLEAMAYGKPVVATNVGGIPDAVEHMKTGVLVSPGNSTALADAIGQVLEDEVLMKRMSRNAREKVEKEFSWAKVAEQVKSLYEQLIAESLAR